jgi:hypothetical protein
MLADLEDEDDILTWSMIGGDAGLLMMAALSSKLEMSRTRARLINIGGIIGTLYGIGTSVLFEIDSKRDFWSVLGVSSILGLATGAYFTRGYDAEKGYFADAGVNTSVGYRLSVVGVLITEARKLITEDSGLRRIPETKLQIPLVSIKF